MHKPYKVDELIKRLNKIKTKDKEVVILQAHNYYDIVNIYEENNSVVIKLKLCYNRDKEDDGDDKTYV